MTQLYQIGEPVILCSKSYPQYNGDGYVVVRYYEQYTTELCRVTGRLVSHKAGSYLLDPPRLSQRAGVEISWLQSALRKKHKPADESFHEMMSNLKTLKTPLKQP